MIVDNKDIEIKRCSLVKSAVQRIGNGSFAVQYGNDNACPYGKIFLLDFRFLVRP